MNDPELQPVESSTIKALGYNAENLELHVQFKSGHYHVYRGVSPAQYTAFKTAESLGKHFHERIKGRFESEKR